VQILSEVRDGVAIIKIVGKLMFDETLLTLRHEVRELLEEGVKLFVLDMTDVPHCDSSGSGEVIGAYTTVAKAGGSMVVVGLTDRVRLLWTRVKLTDVFDVFPSVAEAEAFIRRFGRNLKAKT
jgi:anti-sigma B factor antagonist